MLMAGFYLLALAIAAGLLYLPYLEWRVLRRYLEATGAANDDNATTIVIWPEGAIPVVNFFMLEDPNFLDAIGRALGDRVLIAGATRRENTPRL